MTLMCINQKHYHQDIYNDRRKPKGTGTVNTGMKNIRSLLLLFVAAIIVLQACSPLRKGNKYYKRSDYVTAARYYERVVNRNGNPEAIIKLADSYRRLKDYIRAEEMYAKAVKLEKKNPIVHFYYAEMLRNNNKMEEAKEQYKKYVSLVPDDLVAEVKLSTLDEVKVLMSQTPQYDLLNIEGINTRGAEFSPMLYKNGLVFVAERTTDLVNFDKYDFNSQPYLDIYYSEQKKGKENTFSKARGLSSRLNSFYHDGPITFNEDRTLAFFTRVDVTSKRDTAYVNRPRLYSSHYIKGSWSKPEPFTYNSDKYLIAHPALSPDGKTLFFVSDMPGGKGGKDIYVSMREGDSWSAPVNIGDGVNTPGNELFPYFRKDGTLFFSSDGHPGLGGLDIFYANMDGGKWTNVTNMGLPINSTTDDFGIVFENNGDARGYFSSNRAGGKGSDDIYGFVSNGKFIAVGGKILLSQDINDPARNAKIMLLREDGTVIKTATTDANGNFRFDKLPSEQKYMVKLDENDPALSNKSKYYMADESNKIVRVTVLNDAGGKFVFQNLPADPNSLPQLDANDVTIAGNLLVGHGQNPSMPLANQKVNLVNEKGEVVQTTTTNAFGAFVFTNLPAGQDFLVRVDETDTELQPNSRIIITNKSGKELQSTTAGPKGEFKFSFLSSDQASMSLLSVEDSELRFDMKGILMGPDKQPLTNSKINLVNDKGEVIQTVTTDAKGAFAFASLPADQNFLVMMDENDSRLEGLEKLLVADEKGNVVRELKAKGGKFRFNLLPSESQQLGTIYVDDPWLKVLKLKTENQQAKRDSLIIIENIYYDYGKADILPEAQKTLDKVIQVMKNDPDITIEISSHTDSRSSAEYNLTLSQKRAKSAVDYIVKGGIPASRMSGVGYGESKLINNCKDGVECSEEEHAKNRRTEFKIVRNQGTGKK